LVGGEAGAPAARAEGGRAAFWTCPDVVEGKRGEAFLDTRSAEQEGQEDDAAEPAYQDHEHHRIAEFALVRHDTYALFFFSREGIKKKMSTLRSLFNKRQKRRSRRQKSRRGGSCMLQGGSGMGHRALMGGSGMGHRALYQGGAEDPYEGMPELEPIGSRQRRSRRQRSRRYRGGGGVGHRANL
jgi:hypothetical protein